MTLHFSINGVTVVAPNSTLLQDDAVVDYGIGVIPAGSSNADFGSSDQYLDTWENSAVNTGETYTNFSSISRTVACNSVVTVGISAEDKGWIQFGAKAIPIIDSSGVFSLPSPG